MAVLHELDHRVLVVHVDCFVECALGNIRPALHIIRVSGYCWVQFHCPEEVHQAQGMECLRFHLQVSLQTHILRGELGHTRLPCGRENVFTKCRVHPECSVVDHLVRCGPGVLQRIGGVPFAQHRQCQNGGGCACASRSRAACQRRCLRSACASAAAEPAAEPCSGPSRAPAGACTRSIV